MALQVGELYAQLTMESKEFDKGVGGIKDQLGKLGGVATGIFAGVIGGAVVALGGAMVAGVSSVNDYQKAMNGLSVQTGLTGGDLSEMGDSMKNIYANNFGDSFEDIADTMARVSQATARTGDDLENLTQNALMMRDAFGYEVQDSVRGADMLMRQFGVNGDEAMAMIAEATQAGLNKSDDLIDTIDEYSVHFENAGLSAEDMFGVMQNASNAGVRNMDLVGDAVKEFSIIMKEDGDKAHDALTKMGLPAEELQKKFAAGGEGAKESFQTIITELGKIEDPLERNKLGVELFGTKFEDLEAKAILAMGNLEGSVTGSKETLESINAIKYDDFGSAMAGIGRQLTVGIIMPIGEKILPLLNDFANWISSNMPAIQGFFEQAGAVISAAFDKMSEKLGGSGDLFNQWKDTLMTGFQTVWGVVGPLVSLIGEKVMEVFSMIIDWWNANGKSLLENVMIVFQGIWSVIQFIMPAILAVVSMVFENVKGVITGALNIISGVFAIFAGLFTGNWSKMWDGVKQLVGGAVKFIWNLWNLLLVGRLLAGIKMLGTKALSMWSSMWKSIGSFFSKMASSIGKTASSMVQGVVTYFKNLFTRGVEIFQSMRKIGGSVFESLKQAVYNTILTMKNSVVSVFNGIKSSATTIFNNVKSAITKPIETAKSTILGIIDKIKGAFDKMKITIPKPKLPKINIGSKTMFGGKGGIPAISIPTFSVDWFKTGGIATGPAIAGIGEAGSEAIVPLAGRRMLPFSKSIAKQMAGMLGELQPAGGGGQTVVELIIDGQRFARAVAKPIKEEQQRIEISEDRGRGKRRT